MGCKSCEMACAVEHSTSKSLFGSISEKPLPIRRLYVEKAGGQNVPLVCRHCTDAFQILPGGYAQRYASHGWQQITTREASKPKILTPPPGSRRDRRHRGRGRWRRSERRTDR